MPKEKCEVYIDGLDDGTGTGNNVYLVCYNKVIKASSPKTEKFKWHVSNNSGVPIQVSIQQFVRLSDNTPVNDTDIFKDGLEGVSLDDGEDDVITAQVKKNLHRDQYHYTTSITNTDTGNPLDPIVDTPIGQVDSEFKIFLKDIDPELDIQDV
jgi:hypothetical protein